jgi:hypothetical protein
MGGTQRRASKNRELETEEAAMQELCESEKKDFAKPLYLENHTCQCFYKLIPWPLSYFY